MKKNEDGLLRIRGDQIQLCDSNGYWSCLGGTALRSILGIDQVFKRMDCLESGGHDYVFHEKMNPSNYRSIRTPVFYVFKCSKCDKTVNKSPFELTKEEKEALKTLGFTETLADR